MAKTYSVKILSHGNFPKVGRCPKLNPVTISESTYELLKNLGVEMDLVGSNSVPKKFNIKSTKKEDRLEVKEKKAKEEAEEKEQEEYEEENRIEINDAELSGDAYYDEEFLTKKKALKILENRGIDPEGNKASILKGQVIDSNPELPDFQKEEIEQEADEEYIDEDDE
jgi:hypothetical protein